MTIRCLCRGLVLAAFCCVFALSARAQFVRCAQIDLNGDKKAEKITLTLDKKDDRYFTLTIGTASIKGKLDDSIDGFKVVDIDKADIFKEVAVHTPGPSDDDEYRLYWYDGKTIKEVGYLSRWPEFPGYGIVYVKSWAGFWSPIDKYVLNKTTHKLELVKQPFYYVGVTATVEKGVPIYAGQDMKTVVANLLQKSKVLILLNSGDHYLVKSTTGLVGWIKEKTIYESFSGMPMAD
jgi:hypothetical protein